MWRNAFFWTWFSVGFFAVFLVLALANSMVVFWVSLLGNLVTAIAINFGRGRARVGYDEDGEPYNEPAKERLQMGGFSLGYISGSALILVLLGLQQVYTFRSQ